MLYAAYIAAQIVTVVASATCFASMLVSMLTPSPLAPSLPYNTALLASLVVYVISVYSTFGFKLSKDWLANALPSSSMHFVFYALCALSLPMLVGMLLPPALYATVELSRTVHALAERKAAPSWVPSALVARAPTVINAQRAIAKLCAQMEVFQIVLILLNVFTGNASVLSVVMYAQFLSLRNAFSADTAVELAKVDGWLAPFAARIGPVNWVYNKIKTAGTLRRE